MEPEANNIKDDFYVKLGRWCDLESLLSLPDGVIRSRFESGNIAILPKRRFAINEEDFERVLTRQYLIRDRYEDDVSLAFFAKCLRDETETEFLKVKEDKLLTRKLWFSVENFLHYLATFKPLKERIRDEKLVLKIRDHFGDYFKNKMDNEDYDKLIKLLYNYFTNDPQPDPDSPINIGTGTKKRFKKAAYSLYRACDTYKPQEGRLPDKYVFDIIHDNISNFMHDDRSKFYHDFHSLHQPS